jgi:putative redox protein
MRDVTVRSTAQQGLATDVSIGPHHLRLDEPLATPGGTDTGAEPPEVLLAALGACETITLRMYAARKGWPLDDIRVRLNGTTVNGATSKPRAISTRHSTRACARSPIAAPCTAS